MVPLALTTVERRLVAAAGVAACLAGVVAAAYVVAWCLAAAEGELLGAALIGLVLYAPTWAASAAGARLAGRARAPWMDTRSLPRPTLVLMLAAPLVVATTSYDAIGVADAWRWASMLPAVAAVLALVALLSTLWRRVRRRDASRWSPIRDR